MIFDFFNVHSDHLGRHAKERVPGEDQAARLGQASRIDDLGLHQRRAPICTVHNVPAVRRTLAGRLGG